jgi:hypothetical protein
MDEIWVDIDKALTELEDFCIKTLAEVSVLRLQVNLLKDSFNRMKQ